ncbi:hypothetical protein SAMN02927914_06859, partial [Mesorhizobium qingshengii]
MGWPRSKPKKGSEQERFEIVRGLYQPKTAVLSQRSKRDKGWQESGSAFYAVRMANCSAI